jgi:uncharacterized protein YoxC
MTKRHLVRALAFALAAASVSPAWAPDAWAGKGDKEQKAKDWAEIEKVGIPSIDAVFTKVAEMQRSISTVELSLTSANTNLTTALGLPQGTPFADALADLQQKADGKLKVVTEGGTPKLTTSDAVPSNVQAGVDAVNGFTGGIGTSVTALQQIPSQAQAVIPEVQALPAKFPAEAKDLGAKVTEIPKMLSAIKNNVDATVQTPARAEAALTALTGTLTTITSTFGAGSWSPGAASNTGAANKPGARPTTGQAPGPRSDTPGQKKTRPTGR